MHFSLVPALALLATFAVANPIANLETRTGGGNNCDGGDTYCCNNTPVLGNPTTGFIPVNFDVITSLTCSPLTVLGVVLGTSWYVLRCSRCSGMRAQ